MYPFAFNQPAVGAFDSVPVFLPVKRPVAAYDARNLSDTKLPALGFDRPYVVRTGLGTLAEPAKHRMHVDR